MLEGTAVFAYLFHQYLTRNLEDCHDVTFAVSWDEGIVLNLVVETKHKTIFSKEGPWLYVKHVILSLIITADTPRLHQVQKLELLTYSRNLLTMKVK